jgi:hypothetical protein
MQTEFRPDILALPRERERERERERREGRLFTSR